MEISAQLIHGDCKEKLKFLKNNSTGIDFLPEYVEAVKEQVLEKELYLFKAKNIHTSQDVVRILTDAHLSSQEEAVFGTFLEGLAIYICGVVFKGKKSAAEGIDLEFGKKDITYVVIIKSGPNWGNSGQNSFALPMDQ